MHEYEVANIGHCLPICYTVTSLTMGNNKSIQGGNTRWGKAGWRTGQNN